MVHKQHWPILVHNIPRKGQLFPHYAIVRVGRSFNDISISQFPFGDKNIPKLQQCWVDAHKVVVVVVIPYAVCVGTYLSIHR